MRVITGTARGTKLKTPQGEQTRPTSDRVKEAIFSIIQFDIAGEVLDLFAGTGQLGIEALSRGAQSAVFVDELPAAVALVQENLRRTHLSEKASVIRADYKSYLAHCRNRFRIIFLDPPYAEKSLENALICISEIDILADGGIIVTERSEEKPLLGEYPGLERSKDYKYGKTIITLFRKTSRGGAR
ncbi:MAG: 16S rRNA (guanine(966)-N(2))-methyltransferase RsmD [Oscillospiraceae bacterium]|jgi:16S rRNA (guanine(966)-N(2))-methyltransferase RsmD|nr:16S rRNA (guanine(966)-N(2))-methyltransferase RsmD [Oscillospiraceae bacterium]